MPSKRQVLGYFPNPKQEAHVSVHSEGALNRLAWWSGGCYCITTEGIKVQNFRTSHSF